MVSMHTSPLEAPGAADAGGMNVVEWSEALALAEIGYEVDLLTRRADSGQPDVVDIAQGVRLLYLDAGPATALPKSEIDQYIPQFGAELRRLPGYDIYHCQHWMSGIAALDVAHEYGAPLVISYHSVAAHPGRDLSEGEPPESPRRVPGEYRLAKESDHVIAISAAEARTVIFRCGAAPDKVSIIPPGVDLNLFHPIGPGGAQARFAERKTVAQEARSASVSELYGKKIGTIDNGMRKHSMQSNNSELKNLACAQAGPIDEDQRPYLAYAARLQPLKGPDLAIRALASIDPAIRPRLVIAGAQSLDFADYAAELRTLVRDLGLNDDVSFIGPQSRTDLADLFAHASLVLVPSYSETFGLVALEAAACGTPVIASAAGGLREAVVHGESGQLMDSRNPEDWAQAITSLLVEPQTLARMGVVARVHARRFTWGSMARQVADVYESLLS